MLGGSLAAIAREKAGILKAGVPVVLGPIAARGAREILGIADETGATVIFAESEAGHPLDGPLGLDGAHQRDNAASPSPSPGSSTSTIRHRPGPS